MLPSVNKSQKIHSFGSCEETFCLFLKFSLYLSAFQSRNPVSKVEMVTSEFL